MFLDGFPLCRIDGLHLLSDPILSASSPTLACNNDGNKGPNQLTAKVKAGSAIKQYWNQVWPHDTGPVVRHPNSFSMFFDLLIFLILNPDRLPLQVPWKQLRQRQHPDLSMGKSSFHLIYTHISTDYR